MFEIKMNKKTHKNGIVICNIPYKTLHRLREYLKSANLKNDENKKIIVFPCNVNNRNAFVRHVYDNENCYEEDLENLCMMRDEMIRAGEEPTPIKPIIYE